MNFTEAYEFLLSLQNLRPVTEEAETAPERFRRLGNFLALWGNPHLAIPHYVHITGTSGKGSTALMIAHILAANGERTGLLTSPHISRITERWMINSMPMPDATFIELIHELKHKLDQFFTTYPDSYVTYHELLSLIGFIYFHRHQVSWAVIEVGIGGDLDATNIIPHKEAAVITTIGPDHLELLGPTLVDVARHKAGIITAATRVITSVEPFELRTIIKQQATATQSSYTYVANNYQVIERSSAATTFAFNQETYTLHAFGDHQLRNALVAIQTATELNLSPTAIKTGLQHSRFPLRLELLHTAPWILTDGAHNPEKLAATVAAVKELRALLAQEGRPVRQVNLITGFSRNKDIAQAVATLAELQPGAIAATRFSSNPFRAATAPSIIARQFSRLLPQTLVRPFVDSAMALAWIRSIAHPQDLILITGSIFLGGELRAKLIA